MEDYRFPWNAAITQNLDNNISPFYLKLLDYFVHQNVEKNNYKEWESIATWGNN